MAAYACVLVMLLVLFVRRANLRRLGITVVVLWWLLVCFDRMMLGRHFPTDVYEASGAFIWGATARMLKDLFERLEPLLDP